MPLATRSKTVTPTAVAPKPTNTYSSPVTPTGTRAVAGAADGWYTAPKAVAVTKPATYVAPPPVTVAPPVRPPANPPVAPPVTPPVAPPVTPPPTAPPGRYDNSLDQAELTAALAQIEAQFGLTRQQLLAAEGETGDLYRFLFGALSAREAEAVRTVEDQGVARGIIESGIYRDDQARVANTFGTERSQLEQERGSKLQAINSALGGLGSAQAAARARAGAGVAQQQLATQEQLAQLLQLAQSGQLPGIVSAQGGPQPGIGSGARSRLV